MIENIKAGERITQAVLLRLQKVGNSSNGGVFARGTVEDNSGKIQFIAFDRDIVNRLRDLDAPKAFMISGPVDIVTYSSTLALQNLCLVYIVKSGHGEAGLKEFYDHLHGVRPRNAGMAHRMYERIHKLLH